MESRTATGTIAGRYRIRGLLGEGGMARVFDAFDDRLERRVAVKLLRPETEALPGMRKRFQQEALLAARLIHPNIVAVLDYGEDDSSSYLVMERLPGSTLRDEMARGPMPVPRVVLVMTEALTALAAAHRFGVLHRDIKPSNILLQENGHTKISDFGIAKSVDVLTGAQVMADDMTLTGMIMGTPGYLAPERRSGHPATPQSDLYSVGAVLVEALTGRRDPTGAISTDELPPRLRDVAGRALATDPNQRFPSAEAMLHALRPRGPGTVAAPPAPTEQIAPTPVATLPLPAVPTPATLPGTAILHRPEPVGGASPARRRRRRIALVTGMAIAAALIVALVLVTSRSQPTGPPAASTSHHVADPEGNTIRQLANSIAGAGLPGDRALASALDATAAQHPGTGRVASAEDALALAQVLLLGGSLTPAQFQDVVSTLQPTGAAVPTTTTTTTTAPPPPAKSPGHSHHGQGDGQG